MEGDVDGSEEPGSGTEGVRISLPCSSHMSVQYFGGLIQRKTKACNADPMSIRTHEIPFAPASCYFHRILQMHADAHTTICIFRFLNLFMDFI
jgi:hypothetical protein